MWPTEAFMRWTSGDTEAWDREHNRTTQASQQSYVEPENYQEYHEENEQFFGQHDTCDGLLKNIKVSLGKAGYILQENPTNSRKLQIIDPKSNHTLNFDTFEDMIDFAKGVESSKKKRK